MKSVLVVFVGLLCFSGDARVVNLSVKTTPVPVTIQLCCGITDREEHYNCSLYEEEDLSNFGPVIRGLKEKYASNTLHLLVEPDFVCNDGMNEILLHDENITFTDNGSIYWDNDLTVILGPEHYCLFMFDGSLAVHTCQYPYQASAADLAKRLGMIISVPFLLATLIVYFLLPDKKIQTKCLMAYVTCLMLSYIFLVFLQFRNNLDVVECKAVAACGVYFFMATFCWMNITCIDMYLAFSGKRHMIQGRSSKWKRFGMYCLFANGAPIILICIILGLNTHEKNAWYHPQFADGQCWLQAGMPQLLYFYGPMAILLLINTCLFIFTAITIRRTMVESQKMLRSKESQRHFDSNKQDYKLYIKLFIAMGINWIMEFISWIVDWLLTKNNMERQPAVWYVTDFCNAIYGFFIFFIFVCKKTVWIKLKQRYYVCMGKPNMARALSSRQSGYPMTQTEKTNLEDTTTTVTENYNHH